MHRPAQVNNRDHASSKMEGQNGHPKLSFGFHIHITAHFPSHKNAYTYEYASHTHIHRQIIYMHTKSLKRRELSNIK